MRDRVDTDITFIQTFSADDARMHWVNILRQHFKIYIILINVVGCRLLQNVFMRQNQARRKTKAATCKISTAVYG